MLLPAARNVAWHLFRKLLPSWLTPRRVLGGSRQQQLQVLLGAAAAPIIPSGGSSAWVQLTSNYVFCVGFWGWFIAQFLKVRTSGEHNSS